MAEERRQTHQTVAWFWDLFKRGLLELDPPYQRRSVWSQSYKDYFVDTVLLNYPAPAVFLYEDISDIGVARYSVVDGKQRLSTVFEFLAGEFPVGPAATNARFRGLSFDDLPSDTKKSVFRYPFSIEFLPTTDEAALSNIFDRINRNVARLTAQELRHARFSGVFAAKVEDITDHLDEAMPTFPRIAPSSRRQMKDAELVAQLFLSLEKGIGSYSQDEIDAAYSDRDEDWEESADIERRTRAALATLAKWSEPLVADKNARRLRNQADFFSLFVAVDLLLEASELPTDDIAVANLVRAMGRVSSEAERQEFEDAKNYYEAARSASNDLSQRRIRVDFLRSAILGETPSARA